MSGRRIGLVAFDLDGTLLRGETVCEAIARQMGHLERIRELERLRDLDAIAAARAELAGYYRLSRQGTRADRLRHTGNTMTSCSDQVTARWIA